MTKQDAPSDEGLPNLAGSVQSTDTKSRHFWRDITLFISTLVIGVLTNVISSLATADTDEINYLTLFAVIGGFIIVFVASVVIMRREFGPPSRVTSLSQRITAAYFKALDSSLLNPNKTHGGSDE